MSTVTETKIKNTKKLAAIALAALVAYNAFTSHVEEREVNTSIVAVSDLNVNESDTHAFTFNVSVNLGDKLNALIRTVLD